MQPWSQAETASCHAGAQFIHPWGWRLSLALAGAPGILILFAGIVLPDSPNSLAERGKYEEALRVGCLHGCWPTPHAGTDRR